MSKPMFSIETCPDRAAIEARLRETGWTVTESGCWEWGGSRTPDGYGLFNLARLGYVNYGAHRMMYEVFVDSIPDGLFVRHKCDNPPCVNPEHLTPGTHQENMRDMLERGRHRDHGRTTCGNGHDLTLPGALRQVTRKGREGYLDGYTSSVCVECSRARKRESEARRRAKAKAARSDPA